MNRFIQYSISAVLFFVFVAAFQACSFTKSSSADDATGPSSKQFPSFNNDAVPFHGKLTGIYQNVDENYCKSLNSTQNVRQEIVQNDSGAWLTVDNCQSVLAKDVTPALQTQADRSSVLLNDQVLQYKKKENPFEHARLVCRNKVYPNHHVVMVYESADGLVLDQPYYRATDPDFAPVTAVRYQESGVHKNSGLVYDTVYRSTTIQAGGVVGQFGIFVGHQASGRIVANWYVKYSDQFRGNSGECVEEPNLYPW